MIGIREDGAPFSRHLLQNVGSCDNILGSYNTFIETKGLYHGPLTYMQGDHYTANIVIPRSKAPTAQGIMGPIAMQVNTGKDGVVDGSGPHLRSDHQPGDRAVPAMSVLTCSLVFTLEKPGL